MRRLFLVLLLLFPVPSLAQTVAVTAEYRCVINEGESLSAARRSCLGEAKRLCLEKAGTYLESTTVVRDYQLVRDEIRTFTAGLLQSEIVREETVIEQGHPVLVVAVICLVDLDSLKRFLEAYWFGRRKTQVVYEGVFTDADSDQYGRIKTFRWGDNGEQEGDFLEVIGRIPAGAREIKIWRGKQFRPKWHETEDGYYGHRIEHISRGKAFGIWIERGKGIAALVRISRY